MGEGRAAMVMPMLRRPGPFERESRSALLRTTVTARPATTLTFSCTAARHARVTIEQHYSTEVVCGQLSAIYRELAETQG